MHIATEGPADKRWGSSVTLSTYTYVCVCRRAYILLSRSSLNWKRRVKRTMATFIYISNGYTTTGVTVALREFS